MILKLTRSGTIERVLLLSLVVWGGGFLAQAEPENEKFQGWPAGWVRTYQRFENFIAARRASWPRADLEIAEDGTITHGVRIAKSLKEHLSFRIFNNGRNVLTIGEVQNLMAQGRDSVLSPGIYTISLYASGTVGYQHLYPITWFQVQKEPGKTSRDGEESLASVRVLPAFVDPESRWPNERLLLYLDFDIFPQGHPWDIEKKNKKVEPRVSLRLDNSGVVEREKLDDEDAERLLRWRIYRDGELVEKGSAAGVTRLETRFGPGNYQILTGIEGPNGFMPVSNLLEFPLFPDNAGKQVVIPPDENRDGVPDFLEVMAKQGKVQFSNASEGDLDNDGIPDREEYSGAVAKPTKSADDISKRLIELWRSWEYDLKNRPPVPTASDEHKEPALGTRPCHLDTDEDGASDRDDGWPNTRLIEIQHRYPSHYVAMALEAVGLILSERRVRGSDCEGAGASQAECARAGVFVHQCSHC